MSLIHETARSVVAKLKSGEVSRGEVLDVLEARHAEVDGKVNALPTTCFDRARAAEAGTDTLLAGMPVAIKDCIDVGGVRSTAGSSFFSDRIADADAALDADAAPDADAQTSDPSRLWIVTDSVFSMDGDLSPLSDLCDLAERFGADLIVDEAHATGVFGNGGRGVCELTETESRVAVRVGTLSKAAGCLGGFVACSESLREWLWNSARTQMFSTALPPSVCAAASTSLRIMAEEPQRQARLHTLSHRLIEQLRAAGLSVPENVAGPIVPVLLGDAQAAVDAAERLFKSGFLVGAIRPPTVPQQTSRLRVCVNAAFEEADIDELAAAISSLAGR